MFFFPISNTFFSSYHFVLFALPVSLFLVIYYFLVIFTVQFFFLVCNNPLIHASLASVIVFVLSLFLSIFHSVLCSCFFICSSPLFVSHSVFFSSFPGYCRYTDPTPASHLVAGRFQIHQSKFSINHPLQHTPTPLCVPLWRPTSVAIQFISLQHF